MLQHPSAKDGGSDGSAANNTARHNSDVRGRIELIWPFFFSGSFVREGRFERRPGALRSTCVTIARAVRGVFPDRFIGQPGCHGDAAISHVALAHM